LPEVGKLIARGTNAAGVKPAAGSMNSPCVSASSNKDAGSIPPRGSFFAKSFGSPAAGDGQRTRTGADAYCVRLTFGFALANFAGRFIFAFASLARCFLPASLARAGFLPAYFARGFFAFTRLRGFFLADGGGAGSHHSRSSPLAADAVSAAKAGAAGLPPPISASLTKFTINGIWPEAGVASARSIPAATMATETTAPKPSAMLVFKPSRLASAACSA
jgi:hypothetical protein